MNGSYSGDISCVGVIEALFTVNHNIIAVKIIKLYEGKQGEGTKDIFRQLLRSGTSIGANLAEAKGSISQAEFSAKVSIAYKEAQETKYWLSLF